MDEDLVAIARTVKTRGLRGELVADLLTDFPERFDNPGKVLVVDEDGKTTELELEKCRFQNGRIILKFKGIDSIEAAEKWRNSEICINESDAVELEDNEFFDWELENCEVETVEGEKIGTVSKLMRTGGTEILVVEGVKKEYLIPFAETICISVDTKNKMIKVDAPEGLLEF